MQQSSPPERLAYTIAETLERLPISRSQLYRLFDAGELRTMKVGARRLVPASELDAFIARQLEAAEDAA